MDTIKTNPTTIHEAAEQLYRALKMDKRNDGGEFYKLVDGSPAWMTDVIHAAHGDKMPDDTVYEFVNRAAGAFADSDAETENEYSEVISEMEADVYTSDLTAWLNARVDHVDYLTQAIEEFQPENGFDALMMAQKIQIEEVAYALLRALTDFVDDQPEEDSEEDESFPNGAVDEDVNFFDEVEQTAEVMLSLYSANELRAMSFDRIRIMLDGSEIDSWGWEDKNTYSAD